MKRRILKKKADKLVERLSRIDSYWWKWDKELYELRDTNPELHKTVWNRLWKPR